MNLSVLVEKVKVRETGRELEKRMRATSTQEDAQLWLFVMPHSCELLVLVSGKLQKHMENIQVSGWTYGSV
jgi:hypothetical protein